MGWAHWPQIANPGFTFFFAIVTLPMGRRALAHSFLVGGYVSVSGETAEGPTHSPKRVSHLLSPKVPRSKPGVNPAVCLPPPPGGARYGLGDLHDFNEIEQTAPCRVVAVVLFAVPSHPLSHGLA